MPCKQRIGCASILIAAWLVATGQALSADDASPVPATPMPVRSLAFSPDGKLLAAGFGQLKGVGKLEIWDVDLRKRQHLRTEPVAVPSVAFAPDGKTLAVGTLSRRGLLLDAESGDVRTELVGHQDHVRTIAYSPDGKLLATASYDRTIQLRDAATAEKQRELTAHQDQLRGIAFSPDGRWLASAGGMENKARLWDLHADGKLAHTFDADGYVPSLAFSPDGQLLAVPDWGGNVHIFKLSTGAELLRLEITGNEVAFSPDGKWLVIAVNGPLVYCYPWIALPVADVRAEIDSLIAVFTDDDYTKREAASKRLLELAPVALDALRDGQNSPIPEVRVRCRGVLRKYESGNSALKLYGHRTDVECLAFSPDGRLLATGDAQGVIKLWQVRDWSKVATLDGDVSQPTPLPDPDK